MDADFVEAQEIGVSAGSIYPVKDGYRDTVTMSGNRDEAISVSIRSTTAAASELASSRRQRDRCLQLRLERPRRKADVLPEGKYRIVQS